MFFVCLPALHGALLQLTKAIMTIRQITHGSSEYEQMLALRLTVLLQPIGIPLSYINTQNETTDLLLAAFEGDDMIGCCVLTPKDAATVQLRQMAVAAHLQGKGIGAAIVTHAEEVARKKGFKKLMMHARSTVAGFYVKSGYHQCGSEFEEVGIAHYRMEKQLQ